MGKLDGTAVFSKGRGMATCLERLTVHVFLECVSVCVCDSFPFGFEGGICNLIEFQIIAYIFTMKSHLALERYILVFQTILTEDSEKEVPEGWTEQCRL